MKSTATKLGLSVGVLLFVAAVLIAVFRDNDWPAIPEKNKPAILATLTKWRIESQEKRIPESMWPIELRELNPKSILFENGQIDVLISSGGIGPGWGYYITENGISDSKGLILVESKDARFQKYRQRE